MSDSHVNANANSLAIDINAVRLANAIGLMRPLYIWAHMPLHEYTYTTVTKAHALATRHSPHVPITPKYFMREIRKGQLIFWSNRPHDKTKFHRYAMNNVGIRLTQHAITTGNTRLIRRFPVNGVTGIAPLGVHLYDFRLAIYSAWYQHHTEAHAMRLSDIGAQWGTDHAAISKWHKALGF